MVVWNSEETMSPPEKVEKHEEQRGLSAFEPALASRTAVQEKTVTNKSLKRSPIAEETPKITKKRKHGEDKTAIRSLCSESACEEFTASPGQPVYKEEASATVVFNGQLASEATDNLLGMPAREKGVENRNSFPKLLSTSRAPLTEIKNAVSKASQRSDREPKHGERWLKCLPTKSMNNLSGYRWLSLNESVQQPSVVKEQIERLQRSNVAERREMIDLNVVPPEQSLESSINGWKDTTSTTDFILKQSCPSVNRTLVESRWREEENITDYVEKGRDTAKQDGINLHGCLRNEDGLQNSNVVSTEALHINHNMSQPFARNCVDHNSVANQIPREPRNLSTEKVPACYSRKKRASNEIVEPSFSLAKQASEKGECSEPLPRPEGREDRLQRNKQLMEGPTESVESPRAKAAAMILLQMSRSSWDHYGFTSDQESPPKMEETKGRSKNGRLKETKGRSKNGRNGSQIKPPVAKRKKPGNDTKSAVSHLHKYLNTNTDRCQRSDSIPDDETERKSSMSDFQVLSCPSLVPKKRRTGNRKPKGCAAKQGSGNPVCERPERSKDTHKRGSGRTKAAEQNKCVSSKDNNRA